MIKESEYVQSKCVNKLCVNEVTHQKYWQHSLPLKDEEEWFGRPENWNLPKDEILKIERITKELVKYANLVIDVSYFQKGKLIKNFANEITDILPPWIVFPLYNSYTKGWRMGIGEEYVDAYIDFLRSLTKEEFEIYDKTYPQPEYMVANAFSLNVINYDLRKGRRAI